MSSFEAGLVCLFLRLGVHFISIAKIHLSKKCERNFYLNRCIITQRVLIHFMINRIVS